MAEAGAAAIWERIYIHFLIMGHMHFLWAHTIFNYLAIKDVSSKKVS